MRHLKHNTTSPTVFIDDIIASKRARGNDNTIVAERAKCEAIGAPRPPELTYKERCSKIRAINEAEIKIYETAFGSDNLILVPKRVPHTLRGDELDSKDMADLYSFSSEPMGRLWTEVLTNDGYLNDMCPICGSVKATTFDHYLPKTDYQLFAVHPMNLIPCCTVCNEHKLKNAFDANNKRLYWNAYLDEETSEQYLFCDIIEENGMPKAIFRVEQGNLPDRYFEIVRNTFNDLLRDNYRDSSGARIKTLKNSCCSYYIKNQEKGLDACIQVVADTIPDCDVNNWGNVLNKALIKSDSFKRLLVSALKNDYGINLD